VKPGLDRRSFLRRSGVTGLVLFGGGGAILAACGDDGDTDTSSGDTTAPGATTAPGGTPDYGVLEYQLSWIKNVEFAGMYLADVNGYYKAEGFESVNFTSGGPNVQQDAIVASGKAFIGISTPDIAASAIIGGAPNIILGAQYQKNPFCVMSLADNPIETPEAMYGKKIGVQSVNLPVWEAFLTANDLDASQIEVVPAQFDPQPLVAGETDGWFSFVTNEPNLLKTQGIDTFNLLLNDFGYPLVSEVYIVTKESLANEREKIKAILRADIKGWWDSYKDPSAGAKLAAEVYGKDLGLDAEEQTLESEAQNELIFTEETMANGIFTISDTLLAETMATLKLAGIEIEESELFDLSVINEVYEENPELVNLA
jgi:ABC-type nitrate/sulfonate/bicarbonate transport system substrate-binding protein